MSNRLLTTSEITNEALRILTNKLHFTKKVNRTYDDRFAKSGAKIGATLNIRKPAKFRFATGSVIDIQGLNETYTNVTLDTQYQRSLGFTSADRALSLDLFSKRVLEPAMISMANQIDYDGFIKSYARAFNQVGTATNIGDKSYTDRDSYNTLVGDANTTLTRFLTPQTPRSMIVDPQFMVDGATLNTSIFNPQNVIGDQYEDAALVRALGFDWYDTQNAPVHTVGVWGGTGCSCA